MRLAALVFGGLMAAASLSIAPPSVAQAQQPGTPATPPFKDNYVQANGLRMHYVSTGEGPMVLFLHGYPSFWYQWKEQLTEMGKDHFAVAPDLRGYNLTTIPKGTDQYQMKYLVEDIRDFAEKVGGKGKKFVLVGHDWGGLLAWTFAMYHPEMLEKLIIINAPHPIIFEREMNENPVQRFGSSYTYAFNNFDGYKWDEKLSENDFAGLTQGILGEQIKSGRYTPDDVAKWKAAWSVPGALNAGLEYYRANHLNPPFNEQHPASAVPGHWTAKDVLQGAKSTTIRVPTLVIWGLKDTALQTGNLSGMAKLVPNVTFRLYPNDTHWVSISKPKEVNQDIRNFIEGKEMPKESSVR